jgi:hypothetical protein
MSSSSSSRAYTEGLWTPEILGAGHRILTGMFLDVYRQLMQAVLDLVSETVESGDRQQGDPRRGVRAVLLDKGIHVVIILRDPRDMIASLNFSERDNATGSDRPVLYSMRIWRKSVATAIAFEGHPCFPVAALRRPGRASAIV